MALHKAFHHKDDVDLQYLSRQEERRELARVEDSFDALIQKLKRVQRKKRRTDYSHQIRY